MEENVFSIPLNVKKVERRNRAKRAVREVKRFISKQTDKDIKIDRDLNDKIWSRGAKKPPSSVKVRILDQENYVLVQPPEKEIPSEEEFECEECGKTFSTERGLKVHKQRSHEEAEEEEEETEKEKYVCEKCGKEFDTKRGLSIHESQAHKEEEGGEEDYEEVLGGTISEAEDEIEGMESPDYEKLLEVEGENKDRKGMKKFLQKNIEG